MSDTMTCACGKEFADKIEFSRHRPTCKKEQARLQKEIKLRKQRTEMVQQMQELIGDEKKTMFFIEWMQNGKIASKAYRTLFPQVTKGTSEVMGSRWLSEINVMEILSVFDLGIERYFKELDAGLKATKLYGKNAIEHPDWGSRRKYHQALGETLGIEAKGVTVQNNQFNFDKLADTIYAARVERGLEQNEQPSNNSNNQ